MVMEPQKPLCQTLHIYYTHSISDLNEDNISCLNALPLSMHLAYKISRREVVQHGKQ